MFYLLFAKKLQLDTNGLNIKSEEMFVIEIVSFHQKEKKTYLFTKYYFRFICTIISWKLFIIMKISEYHLYYFLKSKAVCKRWTEVKSAVGIIFSRCWVFCLGILNFDINIWFKTLLLVSVQIFADKRPNFSWRHFVWTHYGRVFSREV